ncbi:MAG: helix-turn-helix domain-containing protein [Candidatus Aenigmatarchaeota archaeon]|nr:HAD hydrolase-like protein [Candidatus Aenigmarchaeota archaeon]
MKPLDECVEWLKSVGLQEYQAKVLLTLSIKGVSSANEISKSSNVPITKIYGVLNSLENLGFVESTLGRPKKYMIKDIKGSLEYLLNKKKFKIEEMEKNMNKILEILENKNDKIQREKRNHSNAKVISFDLDGCLTNNLFDEILWRTEIPKQYAKSRGISFEQAYREVTKEYENLWGKTRYWRDPEFWLNHLNIDIKLEKLIQPIKHKIKVYGDVIPVLENLSKKFNLIIVSHANRNLLDIKIKKTKIDKFFIKTFSTVSDFGSMSKDACVFNKVSELLNVPLHDIIHIGDDYQFDYMIPTSVGIRSFIIDRRGRKNESYVIKNLFELETKI